MTDTIAPEAAPPTARPGSRRRTFAVLTLLGVLVLAVVGWQVAVHTYELEPGNVGMKPDGAVKHVAGKVEEYRFPAVQGAEHRILLSVANPGPFPVRITGFGGDPMEFPLSMYPITKIEMDARGPSNDPAVDTDHLVPFTPVTLPPQTQLVAFLTIRIDKPAPFDGGCARTWMPSMKLRFTVLGVGREQDFPLDPIIGFGPSGAVCGEE